MAFTVRGLTSENGGFNSEKYEHRYTKVVRLRSDNRTTDNAKQCLIAVQALGYTPYAAHPDDPFARVLDISCQTGPAFNEGNSNGILWDATIEFGPVNPLTRGQADPTDQPLRPRLDPITVERPVFVDVYGDFVGTTAGDPYDPPLTEEVTEYLLTVLRNEITVDIPALCALSGKGQVNDATWNGYPEKTVKVLPIKIPERLWSEAMQVLYYPMEYVFHINFETWTRKVINQGFGELYGTGPAFKRRAIIDDNGQPITTPAMIDADGHKLVRPFDHTDIVINEHEINEAIDFTVFNLDDVFA